MSTGLDVKIADMDFNASFIRDAKMRAQMNTRIRNALQRKGIMTLGELVALSANEMPDGLGIVSIEVIKATLRVKGLKLKRGS